MGGRTCAPERRARPPRAFLRFRGGWVSGPEPSPAARNLRGGDDSVARFRVRGALASRPPLLSLYRRSRSGEWGRVSDGRWEKIERLHIGGFPASLPARSRAHGGRRNSSGWFASP